jgi:A/G-specific adenine glycosylase
MELGAVVCTPRQPRCADCPVRSHCLAYRDDLVDKLPRAARRAATISRRYAAFVFTRDDKVLVRQRPARAVNARLWEFPNAELANGDGEAARLAGEFAGPIQLERVHQLRHSITRYRIRLEVFHAELKGPGNRPLVTCKWKTQKQLKSLPFTGAHRKILDWLALHRLAVHSRLPN